MRRIYVTFQKAGVHQYKNAPEDVKYLRAVHRHLFKFKVTIEVFHLHREVEYHQFLNWLESLYVTNGCNPTLDMNNKSCESIAEELLFKVRDAYPDRFIEVDVSEDGECGSIISWPT